MGSYIAKASKDLADRRFDQGDSEKRKYDPDEADEKEDKKLDKREQGIARAAKKITKENVDASDVVQKLIDSGKFTKEEIESIINSQFIFSIINLRDNILKSQIAYYNGLIAKHQQNVEIYLNQPVGIGEHSDVMAAIDGEINSIAQAHEKIEIINHYFLNR